jgi:hypothetical protein
MNAKTYKPGTTLKLDVMRVAIYASPQPSAERETTKTVTVLSTGDRCAVVRIKGVRNPERAIAQLTDGHLLVGFGGTGRPVKYEVHAVREIDAKRYPAVVYVDYHNKRYNRMSDTRTVCRVVDSRHVLDECRAFTKKAVYFQVGCNGWSWDAGRAA